MDWVQFPAGAPITMQATRQKIIDGAITITGIVNIMTGIYANHPVPIIWGILVILCGYPLSKKVGWY